jgi:hypothetical protein
MTLNEIFKVLIRMKLNKVWFSLESKVLWFIHLLSIIHLYPGLAAIIAVMIRAFYRCYYRLEKMIYLKKELFNLL